MGYQIQYGQTAVKTYIPERKRFRFNRKSVKILIVCVLIMLGTILGSRETIQNFFLPGNSQITREAVTQMVTNLKEGEPLAASFEAFCREIVDGANIPK